MWDGGTGRDADYAHCPPAANGRRGGQRQGTDVNRLQVLAAVLLSLVV